MLSLVWSLVAPNENMLQGHVAALRSAVTAAELVLTAHSHASHVFSTLECSKDFSFKGKISLEH